MRPDVLVRQTGCLAADVRALVPSLAGQIASAVRGPRVRRVVLVGNGDSHRVSQAAEHAYWSLASLRCEAVAAQRFADYPSADRLDRGTLVVGISASGGSPSVVRALEVADRLGAATLAVTGRGDSPVHAAARRGVLAELPDLEPGPGVRTYQASLLALLLLAIHLGDADGDALRAELLSAADAVERTADLVAPACSRLAPAVAEAPVRFLLGAGPGFGVASYAAAKLVEASGLPSFAQDFEEWWHVERFCRPTDAPLLVVATPGRAADRATALAERARGIGRRVVGVAPSGHPLADLPVAGHVREEFSPLLHGVFAPLLAAAAAEHLDRLPFLGDLATTPPRR